MNRHVELYLENQDDAEAAGDIASAASLLKGVLSTLVVNEQAKQPERAPTTYPLTAEEAGAELAGLRANPQPASGITKAPQDTWTQEELDLAKVAARRLREDLLSGEPMGQPDIYPHERGIQPDPSIWRDPEAQCEYAGKCTGDPQAVGYCPKPGSPHRPQPASWERAVKRILSQPVEVILDKVFPGEVAPALTQSTIDKMVEELRQSLASLPAGGITEQDLEEAAALLMLSPGTPDAERRNERTVRVFKVLKAKLGQPASGVTAEKLAEWAGPYPDISLSLSGAQSLLALLHSQGGIAQVPSRRQCADWAFHTLPIPVTQSRKYGDALHGWLASLGPTLIRSISAEEWDKLENNRMEQYLYTSTMIRAWLEAIGIEVAADELLKEAK